MDLLSPSRAQTDPVRRLWGAITIRVAWDLLRSGQEVRPALLRAARDQALWRLPRDAALPDAEAVASAAVEELSARNAGRYAPFTLDPDLVILPSPAWREALVDASEPIHELVLRLHYADGFSLEETERRGNVDAALLRGARDAVRELARAVLAEDGVSVEGWDPARFDRLLARIATTAADRCPGPGGLATEAGRLHANQCPRCSRAVRLFHGGVLSPGDLFPPEDGACVPTITTDLAAIAVLPEARKYVRSLARKLGDAGKVLADDVILVDASRVELAPILVAAAEDGAPAASQLRIVRRVVLGRWFGKTLLGPGVDEVLGRLSSLAWGEVDGIDPLPEPLPPPPSAARWWAGAGLVALLAVAAGVWVYSGPTPGATVALEASAEPGAVVFDTDDAAWVDVIAFRAGRPESVFHSSDLADKGQLATGDGRYRFVGAADTWVVVASPARVDDLDRVLAVAPPSDADAVQALVRRLRDRYGGAAVSSIP